MLFSLPGARSAPFDFGNFTGDLGEEGGPPPCAIEPSCDTAQSPICRYGISAGDNTIAMCDPTKPNCPMSRRLVPERNIDFGNTRPSEDIIVYIDEKDNKNTKKYLMMVVIAIIAYLAIKNN